MKYGIKNFKAFGPDGAEIELAPITILTGPNGCGKSSFTQSIRVLKSFTDEIRRLKKNDYLELPNIPLDLQKSGIPVGSFKDILNDESATDNGHISFSYTIFSDVLHVDLNVVLDFVLNSSSIMETGKLYSYSISTVEGEVICESSPTTCINVNYNAIRKYIGDISNKEIMMHIYPEYRVAIDSFYRYKSSIFQKDFIETDSNPHEIIIKKRISEQDNAIQNCKDHLLFAYLPIVDELKDFTPSDISAAIAKYAKGNSERNYALEKVIKDFKSSDYNRFIDYFTHKEFEFLNFSNIEGLLHKSSSIALYSSDTDESEDSILNRSYPDIPKYCFDSLLTLTYNSENPRNMEGQVIFDSEYGSQELHALPSEIEEWENRDVSFSMILEALTSLKACGLEYHNPGKIGFDQFPVWGALAELLTETVVSSLSPDFLDNITYLNSADITSISSYSLEEPKEKTSQLLREVISHYSKGKEDTIVFTFSEIEKKLFNASALIIDVDNSDRRVKLFLEDGEIGTRRRLAFTGYGFTSLAFLLLAERLSRRVNMREVVNLENKGYGKKIVDMKEAYFPSTVIVEEPENHLHPKLQSLLAAWFMEAYENHNVQFIIETHSEYLIRKSQTLVADKSIKADDIIIYYIANKPHVTKNKDKVSTIRINERGRLTAKFGPGFFDESDNLVSELIDR